MLRKIAALALLMAALAAPALAQVIVPTYQEQSGLGNVKNGQGTVILPDIGAQTDTSFYRMLDCSTLTLVRTGATRVQGWNFTNTSAAIRYVQIYNRVGGNAVFGTHVPVWTITLAAGQTAFVDHVPPVFLSNRLQVIVSTDNGSIPAVACTIGDVTGTIWYSF